ncbi:MAG: tetratricopeptide repeat protein [Flavobacteriales bacterium]|nr:tetratricopeptide repeat protein [Flavobacteriales bacterium]
MRSYLFLLTLALSLGTASAMDRAGADVSMELARTAYTNGEHATALALFDSVGQEWNSAALQLAIGNCHFKLNDVPRAILHYERALLLEPGAEDVKANLELARQRTVDRVNELPRFSLGSSWERWIGGSDVDQWARRSLWLWSLTVVLCVIALLLRRTLRIAGLSLSGLSLAATLVAVFLAAGRTAQVRDAAGAIVLQPRIEVTSEPRAGSTTLFMLHAGTKVELRKTEAGWCEVALANGNLGWMPASALERI